MGIEYVEAYCYLLGGTTWIGPDPQMSLLYKSCLTAEKVCPKINNKKMNNVRQKLTLNAINTADNNYDFKFRCISTTLCARDVGVDGVGDVGVEAVGNVSDVDDVAVGDVSVGDVGVSVDGFGDVDDVDDVDGVDGVVMSGHQLTNK